MAAVSPTISPTTTRLLPRASIYANPNDTTTNTPVISNSNFNSLRRFAAAVPNVTSIPYYTSNGISNYHAMQAVLKRRFSKGLDLQVGYTWARLLDDAESISNNGGNGFGTYAEQISTIDYGNGNLDVRHRVTGTFNYALPFGESTHGFKSVFVKGWQTNGVVVWNTGMPFSVRNVINRTGTRPSAGTSDRSNMIGSGRISNPNVNQWFDVNDFVFQKVGTIANQRRNQFFAPGLQRVDLSLFKTFDITERREVRIPCRILQCPQHHTIWRSQRHAPTQPLHGGCALQWQLPSRWLPADLSLRNDHHNHQRLQPASHPVRRKNKVLRPNIIF